MRSGVTNIVPSGFPKYIAGYIIDITFNHLSIRVYQNFEFKTDHSYLPIPKLSNLQGVKIQIMVNEINILQNIYSH